MNKQFCNSLHNRLNQFDKRSSTFRLSHIHELHIEQFDSLDSKSSLIDSYKLDKMVCNRLNRQVDKQAFDHLSKLLDHKAWEHISIDMKDKLDNHHYCQDIVIQIQHHI